MKLRQPRPRFTILLPCFGLMTLGSLTAGADPTDRTGSDAPHQERNLAKNDRKSALPLAEINVPEFAGTGKPLRKATAVKPTSSSRKAKDKKKEEQQVKEKPKAETTTKAVEEERPRYDYSDDRVGGDAPHQERGSDPNKRGARLFILER